MRNTGRRALLGSLVAGGAAVALPGGTAHAAPDVEAPFGRPALEGVLGRGYRVLLGAIRNDGDGWKVIDDAWHRPHFIDSVTTNSSGITLHYREMAATKTGMLMVTPDETLTQAGIFAGASVGRDNCVIKLGRMGAMSDYVFHDGTGWVVNRGARSPFTLLPTPKPGQIRLGHLPIPAAEKDDITLTRRGGCGGAHPVISNDTGYGNLTEFKVDWVDASGRLIEKPTPELRMAVSRGHAGAAINPETVNTTNYPNSNLWVFGVHEAGV